MTEYQNKKNFRFVVKIPQIQCNVESLDIPVLTFWKDRFIPDRLFKVRFYGQNGTEKALQQTLANLTEVSILWLDENAQVLDTMVAKNIQNFSLHYPKLDYNNLGVTIIELRFDAGYVQFE